MDMARSSPIPGFQVAFLMFAVALLHAAFVRYLFDAWPVDPDLRGPLGRILLLAAGAAVMAAFPAVRKRCAAFLAPRIPRGRRREIPLAVMLDLACVFAIVGATSLWFWIANGEPALARHVGNETPPSIAMEAALSTPSILLFVFAAGVLAPLVEELAFRGLLHSAWEPAWGWFGSAVATSIVFQAFHGLGVAQFVSGLIYTAIMRRARSMRASIYAHSLFNLLLWYPLIGQLLVPRGASTGEIHLWWFHLGCLAVVFVALPWYLFASRDSRVDARNLVGEPAA